MNTYAYDSEGMLTSAGGAQYVYDALQQRVQKTGGSDPTEVVYFNGHPMALLNATSGAWTDLIWAGSSGNFWLFGGRVDPIGNLVLQLQIANRLG